MTLTEFTDPAGLRTYLSIPADQYSPIAVDTLFFNQWQLRLEVNAPR